MIPNPKNKKSPVKWAKLVRRFLSQQNRSLLQEAILEAKKSNELEIADYLEAFAGGRIDMVDRVSEHLIPKLSRAGRREESLTIDLTALHTGTLLVAAYITYPDDEQKQVRELGIEACQQAIKISRALKDKTCQALYSGRSARGFANSRQHSEAEIFDKKALTLYRQCALKEPQIFLKYVAQTLNNLGNTQNHQSNLAKAENFYNEALKIYRKLAVQEKQSVFLKSVATTLNNLGASQWKQRKLTAAEASFIEVLEIYRKLAVRKPRIYLLNTAATLNNLGAVQSSQRKLAEAEESFTEAAIIYRKLVAEGTSLLLQHAAMAFNNLGNSQSEQGKLMDAEMSFLEALEIRRKLAVAEPHVFLKDVATTLNSLGSAQDHQRKFKDAEASFLEALEIRKNLAVAEPRVFLKFAASTLNNLGGLQTRRKRLTQAHKLFTEALKIYQKLAEKEPDIFLKDVAMTLNNIGAIQSRRKKLTEAATLFAKALNIRRDLAAKEPHIFLQDLAETLNNSGNVHRRQGKLDEAESSYVEALQIRKDLAAAAPYIFNEEMAMVLRNLGILKVESNRLGEATEDFKSARDLIESLRARSITIDDRNRIMQENANVYSGLLSCYIKMQNRKKALETAEQGKSRSLSDLLNLKSEDLQPKAPTPDTVAVVEELGRKYSNAMKKLQQLESYERALSEQLDLFADAVKRVESDKESDEVERQASLQKIFEEKRPLEQEKRKVRNQRCAGQVELKKVLDKIKKYDKDFPPEAKEIDNEEIIEIAESLNRTIVIFRVLPQSTEIIFVFPNGKLKVKTVPNFGQDNLFKLFYQDWLVPYQQWKNSSNQLQNLKEASVQSAQLPEDKTENWLLLMEKTLDKIYKKLMIHVHRILKKDSPTKEVLFIPSQSLAILPLHAASWNKGGKKHYLLKEFTISYCPSVSVFKRCQKNEKSRADKTLVINNPTGDLGFSEKEVEFIKKIYRPNTDLRRKKATKSIVLRALKGDYGIMHFACHGFYNSENQFDSGLVMSNDVIKLSEIINCNLQNNWLTTLSACETGIVDFASPTDEHFGLPLGFIFAGSPSIWASLWSVSDETTSLLMQKAYENLSKEEFHNNKPEALRQAQLSILKEFSHPYYWAGFQHYGI